MFFSPENLTKYRLGQSKFFFYAAKAENMEETIDNLQTPQPLLTDVMFFFTISKFRRLLI